MASKRFEPPKLKSTTVDAELWLYRYNKTTDLNKWNSQTRLDDVGSCFDQTLQYCVMRKSFETWDAFAIAFLQQYTKKFDITKLVFEIFDFSITKGETIAQYHILTVLKPKVISIIASFEEANSERCCFKI